MFLETNALAYYVSDGSLQVPKFATLSPERMKYDPIRWRNLAAKKEKKRRRKGVSKFHLSKEKRKKGKWAASLNPDGAEVCQR
jgi:hypothetical protein